MMALHFPMFLRVAATLAALAAFASHGPAAAEESRKITVGAEYVTDFLANVSGGERRGVGWLGRGDITVEVPGESLGVPGVELFADLMLLHGNAFSDSFVRDGQVVSNIDAPSTVRPIEIWAKANLGEKAYAKIGVIDLNSEFDVQEVGGHFINSSHGIGPDFSQSGQNGPSIFPNTSLGLVAGFSEAALSVRLGAFDALPGSPDHPGRLVVRLPGEFGTLLVGEVELRPAKDAKLVLGVWKYTRPFEMLATVGPDTATSSGVYGLLQGAIASTESGQLDGWIRAGAASSSVNPIAHYLGGGVTFGSERQRGGIAVAHARLGDTGRRGLTLSGINATRAETIIEATYSHRLSDAVQLQPNVQYVINPGWDADRANALVVGVRLSLGISFD